MEVVPLCWNFVHIRKPSTDFNGSEDMRAGSFPMPYQLSCGKSGQMSRDHSAPERDELVREKDMGFRTCANCTLIKLTISDHGWTAVEGKTSWR